MRGGWIAGMGFAMGTLYIDLIMISYMFLWLLWCTFQYRTGRTPARASILQIIAAIVFDGGACEMQTDKRPTFKDDMRGGKMCFDQ